MINNQMQGNFKNKPFFCVWLMAPDDRPDKKCVPRGTDRPTDDRPDRRIVGTFQGVSETNFDLTEGRFSTSFRSVFGPQLGPFFRDKG